jgi:hypothetical protein
MPLKAAHLPAAGDVPEPDGGVGVARGQGAAVRREGQRPHFGLAAEQLAQLRAAGHVPQPQRVIGAGGGQQAVIG